MKAVLSVVLLSSSIALYQIAQKYIPKDLSPWFVLSFAYACAFLLSCIASCIDQNGLRFDQFQNSNWAVWLLGFAVFGLELGFLLSFRFGWQLSGLGLIANTLALLVTLPIAVYALGESMTWARAVGILLCVSGLFLVTKT